MAVVARGHEVEIEAEAVQMDLLRPRQGEAAVRRVRGVVDVEGLVRAVARAHALDRERQQAGDRDGAPRPLLREVDRGIDDAAKIADQIGAYDGRRAARLAADD